MLSISLTFYNMQYPRYNRVGALKDLFYYTISLVYITFIIGSLVKRYSQQLIQRISYLPSNRSIDGILSFHYYTHKKKKIIREEELDMKSEMYLSEKEEENELCLSFTISLFCIMKKAQINAPLFLKVYKF